MARHCKACGRSLDEEGHDIQDVKDGVDVESPTGKKVRIVLRSPTGSRVRRLYGCRVRLIGTSPTSGKRIAPASPQRSERLGMARYAHIDNLKREP